MSQRFVSAVHRFGACSEREKRQTALSGFLRCRFAGFCGNGSGRQSQFKSHDTGFE
jgi:hypothetical protein